MNEKVLECIRSLSVEVSPRIVITLPREYWFVCHGDVTDDYMADIKTVPGVSLECPSQFDGQSFAVDAEEWTPESESKLMDVCRKRKAESDRLSAIAQEWHKLRRHDMTKDDELWAEAERIVDERAAV